ncbi:hypothetical protein F2Q69_00033717 [Brassica cretica]|uniref:ER membrane protein complex subunit 3 n=3 Tax=Brassica cretica TaxID=69181 RepID=A0A8S9SDW5_BRACR|nr:hypothetical protein F2Q69_00033717 [Brassica cretica]
MLVSYVSSCSWYFLNLFGLRGLFSLILGDENAIDDTQRMMQMGGFGFDASKSLSAEKDGLDIIQHEWNIWNFDQLSTLGTLPWQGYRPPAPFFPIPEAGPIHRRVNKYHIIIIWIMRLMCRVEEQLAIKSYGEKSRGRVKDIVRNKSVKSRRWSMDDAQNSLPPSL